MRASGSRLLLGLLLALACGAALWPAPAPEALVTQGLGRLLSQEASTSRPGERAPMDAITAAGGEGAPVHLRVTLDGAPLATDAARRVVSSQLNRYRDATGPADPNRAPVRVELALSLVSQDGALRGRLYAQGPAGRFEAATRDWRVPNRAALLPPLVAVVVALLARRSLLALFLGVWSGTLCLAGEALGGGPGWWLAPLRGLWDLLAVYLRHEVGSRFRIEIIGFIVALIGMVGVMSRCGGVQGLVDRLLGFARTRRSSLLITYAMGLALFFDDYANCMLVGATMRPLTDRLRVSREKLAYLVDSTAAPVAGISLFSTWIAFQVTVYEPQLPSVGIQASGYEIFVRSLPYRFYSLLALAFVLLVVLSGRDLGPMARAEARAAGGALVRPGGLAPVSAALARIGPAPGLTPDWRRAAFPVLATALATLVFIFASGGGFARLLGGEGLDYELLVAVLLAGSGTESIFAGSVVGLALATALAGSNAVRLATAVAGLLALTCLLCWPAPQAPVLVASGVFALAALPLGRLFGWLLRPTARPHLPNEELLRASLGSARTLGFAIVLLFLAWMIGAVCEDLGTADYLVALLGDVLPPAVLPVLLFLVACVVSFATGSSWSTMSILLPNVVGLAAALGAASGLGAEAMVVLCVSAVLEGAIFGDHCSPISDTTVLSSVASGSDHIDHVRTQAPYALLVALVAVGVGYLPVLLVPDWGPLLSLGLGACLLALLLLGLGQKPPEERLARARDLQ